MSESKGERMSERASDGEREDERGRQRERGRGRVSVHTVLGTLVFGRAIGKSEHLSHSLTKLFSHLRWPAPSDKSALFV